MKKVLFIYNPHSGREQIKPVLSDIIDVMLKADYEPTVYATQGSGDATKKTAEDAKHYDLLVCSGGDGTLDEVMTGMMRSETKIPIGFLPAGSTNDFASSLGIENDLILAASVATGGRTFPVDIGVFNDDYFVYVAAFGLFTDVSYQTDQSMKNIFGHAAYILEGIKSLADVPSYRMQVEYNGNVFYDEFIYGMVTNSESVGGFKGIIAGDVSLNDGLFEVALFRSPKNPIELSEILGYLTGVSRDTEMVYSFQTTGVRFTANEEISWTLDGEYGGSHSTVTVTNASKALEIMVPDDAF